MHIPCLPEMDPAKFRIKKLRLYSQEHDNVVISAQAQANNRIEYVHNMAELYFTFISPLKEEITYLKIMKIFPPPDTLQCG